MVEVFDGGEYETLGGECGVTEREARDKAWLRMQIRMEQEEARYGFPLTAEVRLFRKGDEVHSRMKLWAPDGTEVLPPLDTKEIALDENGQPFDPTGFTQKDWDEIDRKRLAKIKRAA